MSGTDGTSIAKSALLMVSMRWIDRLIGIGSTLILARLLLPDDFGVVAQATLIVGLLGVLTDLGVHIALIQRQDIEQSHWDTAWTTRLIQYGGMTALVLLGAPLAGDYFGDLRVVPVLQVMTLTLVLAGIENIGVIAFQKEMRFAQDFRFMFFRRVAGFVATISLALLWQSYWAMVVGAIAGRLAGVILSYLMHEMRPRLSLLRFGEIFSVSQWALLRSVGDYLDNNLDRLLIGGRTNSAIVGGYTVANEIALMPASEVLAPLNRVLFPAFVRARENLVELKRMFLLAQGVQTLIAIPASVGLSLVAPEAVVVLLGDNWSFAVPFLQVLALTYVVKAIAASAGYVLITMGKIRSNALIVWCQVVVFCALVIGLLPEAGALIIALARLLAAAVGLVITFWFLRQVLGNVTVAEVVKTVGRPLLASALMAVAVITVPQLLATSPSTVLLLKIALGATVYLLAVGLMWLAVGRPDGAERYLGDKIVLAWRRR